LTAVGEEPESLERIGFDPFFQAQLDGLEGGRAPARIAIAHGESYIAWTGAGVRKAVLVGRRAASWQTAAERPQVGDWVAGTDSASSGTLVIEHLLERRTCLVRRATGARAEAQVIAANVDVVGIVSAFGGGKHEDQDRSLINEGQLRRYLAAVEQSRAKPVLVVNKSDLSPNPGAVAETLARLFPGVAVVVTSVQRGVGVAQLQSFLARGQTLALVGLSGVGKSTLVNALLGREAQQVGSVRQRDARGRHTTSHRELFLTAAGTLLLDTPGMREMDLWALDDVAAFDDVVALAATCRFSDCRHVTEPACAVHAAVESGALSPERWDAYRQRQQPGRFRP
jgi:ribosome biogenesis GTPase